MSTRSSSTASSTRSISSDTNAQDLKPIKGYLSNRRELARQLFKSVKPDKIRMMLPQILKNANLKELEERCAGELCGMSEARILCILKGRAMSGSSDTGETDDSGPSLEIISDTEEWLTDAEITIKQEPSSSGLSKPKRSGVSEEKRKSRARKRKERENLASGAKGSLLARPDPTLKPKKEKQDGESRGGSTAGDNKEGESLLDLLELEMRARAIRALIRKEEDTPRASEAKEERAEAPIGSVESKRRSLVEETPREKEASGRNHETNKSRVESGSGEDEDVVFVVAKPTPTIELVSSEDEETVGDKDGRKRPSNGEDSRRSGIQRSGKREAATEIGASRDVSSDGRTVTIDKSNDGSNSLKIVVTKRTSESANGPVCGKSSKTRKICDEEIGPKSGATIAEVEGAKNVDKVVESTNSPAPTSPAPQPPPPVTSSPSGKGLFKKIRRKGNLRCKRKSTRDPKCKETEEPLKNCSAKVDEARIDENPAVARDEKREDEFSSKIPAAPAVKLEVSGRREEVAPANESASKTANGAEENKADKEEESRTPITDNDRFDDFEEIIDLDDYPDDMEEIENKDEAKKARGRESGREGRGDRKTGRVVSGDATIPSRGELTESAETWASRYYQTDDVQNVIKESKIQSEIRKRLRERQRLSKSNNSPKLQSGGSPGEGGNATLEKPEEKTLGKATTGSVREYLALKSATLDGHSPGEDEAIDEATDVPPEGKDATSTDNGESRTEETTPRPTETAATTVR